MGNYRTIEYHFWANEQALISAMLLIGGGIIGLLPYRFFQFYYLGFYAIGIGVIVFAVEYPRGQRKKGANKERSCQAALAFMVDKMGCLTKNFFVRFITYFLMSIPTLALLPTLLGGVCLLLASVIYCVAAVKKESWVKIATRPKETGRAVKYTPAAPTQPPPRRPVAGTSREQEVTTITE